jgi:hypothetical protein
VFTRKRVLDDGTLIALTRGDFFVGNEPQVVMFRLRLLIAYLSNFLVVGHVIRMGYALQGDGLRFNHK